MIGSSTGTVGTVGCSGRDNRGKGEGCKVKLTVEKLPVVLGVSIGLSELLEEGLVTGDWLHRAVPFTLVRGAAYGGGRFGLFVFTRLGWRRR